MARCMTLTWGLKRVDPDGTTGSRRRGQPTITWPIEAGGWVEHPDAAQLRPGAPCGPGLHLAKMWRGASMGGCLTDALGLVVGWDPADVLSADADKVRVRRCLVVPGAYSWVEVARIWGRGADLSGANLFGADLFGADLADADLSGANLSGADLSDADLSDANLSGADLFGASLSGANLSGSDLSDADLSGASLSGADLSGASLFGANLSGSDLSGANLSGANLSGANLSGANLRGASLSGAIADEHMRWPRGFDPIARGVIVR